MTQVILDFGNPFVMSVKTVSVEYDASQGTPGWEANQPEQAMMFCRAWNRAQQNPPDQETFSIVGLDSQHHVIFAETVTKGTRTSAPVDGARLYTALLLAGCSAWICTHNHPSGDLEPSRDDKDLTKRLVKGGSIIGVGLLDHIITAPNGESISLRVTDPSLFA